METTYTLCVDCTIGYVNDDFSGCDSSDYRDRIFDAVWKFRELHPYLSTVDDGEHTLDRKSVV